MKFLIQEVEGRLVYDFAYKLLEGIDIANKLHDAEIEYCFCEEVPKKAEYREYIPIGSLEFVYAFLNEHFGVSDEHIVPINIPKSLQKPEYLKREIGFTNKPNKIGQFVKSVSKYKGLTAIYDGQTLPEDNYMVSDYIDIVAEFRVIVMQGIILDVRRYCGEIFVLPNESIIKDMINNYEEAPLSYTLDVGLTKNNDTVILEVHPFVSCGLYGFNQEYYLPYLAFQGFKWLKTNALQEKNRSENAIE